MKTNKQYRFENNPQEKILHDKFIEKFAENSKDLSAIIFGWANTFQSIPNRYLTEQEEDICLTMIQWLGSPVGECFLRDCGYELNKH